MKKEIKLIILIEVQSGKAQQQIALFEKIKPLVLSEQGCLQYELNQVIGSDVQFVLLERWDSEESLKAHDETTHMKEADAISRSFRSSPATVLHVNKI